MTAWCAAAHPGRGGRRVRRAAEAAIGPVLSMADIAADPHYAEREAIVEVDGTPMQGLIAKLSATPGALRWQGRPLDADGDEIRANGWGERVGDPKAVRAGPLFDEGERWWIERSEQVGRRTPGSRRSCRIATTRRRTQDNVAEIFANDRRGIDECDVMVASLNGLTTDDGTAWELGYAFALGKPIIGLHTDWRRRFDDEVVNLMIECSLTTLVRSLDDLPGVLRSMAAGPTATQ